MSVVGFLIQSPCVWGLLSGWGKIVHGFKTAAYELFVWHLYEFGIERQRERSYFNARPFYHVLKNLDQNGYFQKSRLCYFKKNKLKGDPFGRRFLVVPAQSRRGFSV
jgi:hypothetical protein